MDRMRIYLAALAFLLYVALLPPKAYADIIYLSNEEISNLEAGPVTDDQDTVYLNGVLYYVRDGYLEEVVSSPSSIDIHETGLEELIGMEETDDNAMFDSGGDDHESEEGLIPPAFPGERQGENEEDENGEGEFQEQFPTPCPAPAEERDDDSGSSENSSTETELPSESQTILYPVETEEPVTEETTEGNIFFPEVPGITETSPVPSTAPTGLPSNTLSPSPTPDPSVSPTSILTPTPSLSGSPTPTHDPSLTPIITSKPERNQTSGPVFSGGSNIGTFTYRSTLTHDQKIRNLRVGFSKASEKQYAVCSAEHWVGVYMGRGTDYALVGRLYPGDLCYVLADADSQWQYVESGNVRGFVFSYFLAQGDKAESIVNTIGETAMPLAQEVMDPLENAAFSYSNLTLGETLTAAITMDFTTEETLSLGRQELLAYAASFAGNPYVWGGNDPHTGADCSGYVRYIYSHFGISLPRVAEDQAMVGTKISVGDAVPGDLIFMMDENGYIYHVVMYAGNGKTLEAKGSSYGIGCWDLDYGHACWAVRLIDDVVKTS